MNTIEQGAGARVAGIVEKAFTPASGKCAFLTISFPNDRGSRTKVELIAFGDQIQPTGDLKPGELVQVTANIGNKKLTDKARMDVVVDGRPVWGIQLVIRTVKRLAPAEPKPTADKIHGDDDLGW